MRRWCRHRGLRALVLAPALVFMAAGIKAPIHGQHVWRQTHVAANIDKYVQQGLSLRPETYNKDAVLSFFDFPAYQLLVASLCRLFGTDTLATARAASVVSFLLCLVVLDRLLLMTRIGATQALIALALFAYAPINLFYFQAPMVDGLAVLSSILSLCAFIAWDGGGASNCGVFVTMLASGVLAALIKSPVYLPYFLGLLWHRFRSRGWRSLLEPLMLIFVAVIAATVLVFRLYSNAVNARGGLFGGWESDQYYFGPVTERLDPGSWTPIIQTLATQVLNPLTLALSAAGAFVCARRCKSRWASLYLGIGGGAAAAVLVFFNRHTNHNYYQLPLVFPLAFLAAYAIHFALVLARTGRRSGPLLLRLGLGIPIAVVSVTIASAHAGFAELSASPHWMQSRGEWIRERTTPGDFVVYVHGLDENWNPAFLYFAKRDGYNLPRVRVNRENIAGLYARFAPGYARFLIFCADPDTQRQLDSFAEQVAAEHARRLYRLDPAQLRSAHKG